MKTYPRFPQPVIVHPSTGFNWYLEITNGGILRAGGTTTNPPTPISRLRLVDPTGQAAYQLGINSDAVPTVTATVLTSFRDGQYQDLPVWSVNGREWNLRVTAGGSITISAISSDWPMYDAGQAQAGHGLSTVFDPGMWKLTVSEAGITSLDGPGRDNIRVGHPSIKLRSDDDTVSWSIATNSTGTLFVTGPGDVNAAEYFECLLISPNGIRFPMSVNAAGLLSIDAGMEEIDAQNEWPIVWQSRNNILYVVDNRFRAPIPGGRGRGYGRRR